MISLNRSIANLIHSYFFSASKKKAIAWTYLFLSINAYAFFKAADLFFGSSKSLCKKVCMASCSLELNFCALNKVIKRFFLPAKMYQKRQSKGSFWTLNWVRAIYSIHFFHFYTFSSYQSAIEYFWIQLHYILWSGVFRNSRA